MLIGHTDGPPGLTMKLAKKEVPQEYIQITESKQGGHFMFEKVLPGIYYVTATHPSWQFDIVRILHYFFSWYIHYN